MGPIRSVAVALICWTAVSGCERERARPPAPPSGITTLTMKDLRVGNGTEVKKGATAVVHYTGWLYDPNTADHKGQRFDSSRDRGQPFRFRVGSGKVIQGWDEGVVGMKVNGERELLVPPDLGYGSRGAGGVIPPEATLLFEIELLGVE
jgi:FKBP-type peptidyl-prolyl cis-trans isomerase FkpA